MNWKELKKPLFIISFAIILFAIFINMNIVLSVMGRVYSIIFPFVMGGMFAFVINVLLKKLEKMWDFLMRKGQKEVRLGIKRGVCLSLSFVLMLGFVFLVIFLILPELINSIVLIFNTLPDHMEAFGNNIDALVKQYGLSEFFTEQFSINWSSLGKIVADSGLSLINITVNATSAFVSSIMNTVIALVFSIYMLLKKEVLAEQLDRVLHAFVPEKWIKRYYHVISLSNRTFSHFISGQLTEAFIFGMFCFLGMTVMNLPYSLAVSALIGFTALIPVIGAFLGAIIGAFLILLVDPLKAVWFLIFIVLLQQVEGNLIYPKVVGKSVGLPGIWVLMAVTVGGSLFGIAGMLISVPVSSVLYTLLKESVDMRLKKRKEESERSEESKLSNKP